jgi:hypothetical protein
LLAADAAIMAILPAPSAGDADRRAGRARRLKRLVAAIPLSLGFLILSVCALLALMAVTGHLARPQLWELSSGYQGWVVDIMRFARRERRAIG